MKTRLFLATCAIIVLFATGRLAVFFLLEQRRVAITVLLLASLLIAGGLLRGERFTRDSLRNVIPLILAGVISLLFVTILRGFDHLFLVVIAGVLCLGASCWVVVLEKKQRLLSAGVQLILLLYVGGLVLLWGMALQDDWL